MAAVNESKAIAHAPVSNSAAPREKWYSSANELDVSVIAIAGHASTYIDLA